jgi:acyl-CoA reductase-like NAD-dependent aldehyde dehydrogenase
MLHQNLIAGEWTEGVAVNRDINPSNLDVVVGEYARADARQAETAIEAAHEAFKSWSRATPEERSDVLDRVATEVLARKDELGRLLSREEGKTLPEGIG